jgi:penicillin amidase
MCPTFAPEFVMPSPSAPRRTGLGFVTPVALVLLLLTGCADPAPGRRATDFDGLAEAALPTIDGEVTVAGLGAEVEVIRDPYGVPHIYAADLDDLFFAQGFVQAQDRLWQMDMYRRAGEGRLAEILGAGALRHDRLARLVKYRGPWTDEEFGAYHPEGRRIVDAFTAGVNAYIEHAAEAGELPVEYALTGLEPEPWTAEATLLRMQTAMPLGDARSELGLAQDVAELGAEEANRRENPTPYRDLVVPDGVDYSLITDEVVDGLRGFQGGMARPDLAEPYRVWLEAYANEQGGARETSPGSNNWVIAPERSATGAVFMANDPHRGVTNPSLRYVVHLDAPGWQAIGSTEPVLPGVAIGHNGRVAWGLTIVGTDQSDVYIETVNPNDPGQVRWGEGWEDLRVVIDTIEVLGGQPEIVELEYSRHGPIFHRDTVNGLAYAVRSTMHEPGTTGYLPALRLNVVDDCAAFLEELAYWTAPTENMMCGDADGNIAWQASALSPARAGWHGRLPVPGDGRYEWTGFRDDLPEEYNPERGWIATANHDIHPDGYDPPLYFKSGDSWPRFERLEDVLGGRSNFTMADMQALQLDAFSARAAETLPAFDGWAADDPEVEAARAALSVWNATFDRDSRVAVIWYEIRGDIPDEAMAVDTPSERRKALMEPILAVGLDEVRQDLGDDPGEWRWGRVQRSEFPHRLVSAYDIPPVERSGGAGTVAATGATYRHIVDFSDLDGSVFTNAPGQSARPGSPYYADLAEAWGAGEYFPMLFGREAVEAAAEARLLLRPAG